MASGGRLERGKFLSVDADGSPPVIHRARMMVREASGRAGVNLGGIAEAKRFCPICGTKAFFDLPQTHLPPKFIVWRNPK